MLLVLGAAGGVGVSAVQIGKLCGAIVIAVARYFQSSTKAEVVFSALCYHVVVYQRFVVLHLGLSDGFNYRGAEKVQFLESLGVDHVVDSTKGSVTESVKGFLKARKLKGVDVLYDPVGGKLTKETMKLLSWGAKILVIGFASGEIPVIPANIALVKVPYRSSNVSEPSNILVSRV